MIHQINLGVHVVAGIVALVAGAIALCTPKGGRLHRQAGRVFTLIGVAVIITAIAGVILFRSFPALSAATLAVAYQLVSSLRAVKCRATGPSSLDTGIAAAALVATIALLLTMGPGNASWTPAIGYPILGVLAAIAVYDLTRPLWREIWIRRVWRLDHGLKMTNAFFGMLAAGTGNLLPGFHPWSQVGPSMLGALVMCVLVIRHGPRQSEVIEDARAGH
jgi:uncharacterized membrane protein